MPLPPSSVAALSGATILANLSASNITIGKSETRRLLTRAQSARCLAAYVYAAAGAGESTTDLAWDGQVTIDENGVTLARSDRFAMAAHHVTADVDLDMLRQERIRQGTFDDNAGRLVGVAFRRVSFTLDPPGDDIGLRRIVERFPFVPADAARLAQDCFEAYNIQVSGLAQRLGAIGVKKAVIGVSGGLDSTHALIVAARAFDRLGYPRTDILAYTLPGFATGDDTKANAHALMAALGVTATELDIRPAARQMLGDMGHPFAAGEPTYDVTFENVQAGLRTDYLFRLANQADAIVIGTGDLSELALGWCTYGVGDQMSHYNVNGGVPKTLIQHLIRWVIETKLFEADVGTTLQRIVDTEISPELVPVAAGETPQSTEAKVGPYALQDFNLFYTLRYGFRSVEDRVPGAPCLGRRRGRRLAARLPGLAARGLRSRHGRQMAGRVHPPLLRLQPVQALGHAERSEGRGRRLALPRAATGVPRQTAMPRRGWRIWRRAGTEPRSAEADDAVAVAGERLVVREEAQRFGQSLRDEEAIERIAMDQRQFFDRRSMGGCHIQYGVTGGREGGDRLVCGKGRRIPPFQRALDGNFPDIDRGDENLVGRIGDHVSAVRRQKVDRGESPNRDMRVEQKPHFLPRRNAASSSP